MLTRTNVAYDPINEQYYPACVQCNRIIDDEWCYEIKYWNDSEYVCKACVNKAMTVLRAAGLSWVGSLADNALDDFMVETPSAYENELED